MYNYFMIIGKIVTDLEAPFDILLVKCRRPFRNMGGEYHDDILGITITEPFLKDVGAGVSLEDLEYAKEDMKDDDYDIMFNPKSNDYKALAYNYVLDQYQNSAYRLLRGYCRKRKCFDIVFKDEYSINK